MTGNLPEKLSQKDLDAIAKKHENFLSGKPGGARAVIQDRDMSGLSFQGANFSQADFSGSIMANCQMIAVNLESATLFGCDFRGSVLKFARLSKADLRGIQADGADFENADLSETDLRDGKNVIRNKPGGPIEEKRGAFKGNASFVGANLKHANLKDSVAINADFTGAQMENTNLRNTDFRSSGFSGANISNSDFTGADIRDCDMGRAVLTGVVMEQVEKSGADFALAVWDYKEDDQEMAEIELTLDELIQKHTAWVATAGRDGEQLDLSGKDLRRLKSLSEKRLTALKAVGAIFYGMNLQGVELQSASLSESDLRACDISHADMRGSNFRNALLDHAVIHNTKLTPLVFKGSGEDRKIPCNFSGASLQHTDFRSSQMKEADFTGANLNHANFNECDLRGADFTGALLDGANFDGAVTAGAKFDPEGVA